MFYPMMINLENKIVTIVGGGKVAFRKAKKFLEYNAKLKVISLDFIEEFKEIENNIEIIKDVYKKKYIENSFLVVGATSCKEVNEDVANYCKTNNILCNIADDIELSDFIVPSSIQKGDLTISISTMGKSPSLAAKIKKELEEKYNDEYIEYINILGEIREIVLEKYSNPNTKKKILNEIVNLTLEELKKRRYEYENSCGD